MSDLDELLRPTITNAEKRPLPWRVSSQFWVAFLGGVPAVTAIAFFNAGRLGVDAVKRRWILVAGIAAFVVTIALMAWLGVAKEHRSTTRIVVRVVAVLLYFVLARLQRDDDGRHQVFGSGQYASLWGAGIVATLFSFIVTLAAGVAAVSALR